MLTLPTKAIYAATSLVVAAALGAASASAQSVDARAAMSDPAVKAAVNACTGDRNRLCSGVWPGGGRIVRCLAAKAEQLSPGCRMSMEEAREALIAAGIVKPEPIGPQ